ncbi:MAG: transporter substrate-binding domain-containing protein, partial [Draconibacterium sp.]|nr:transporter substrate-binding domain-containing protein [Draconibacterium sp.]
MIKKTYPIAFLIILVLLFACNSEKSKEVSSSIKNIKVERDLKHILKDGKLKVLTTYSSTSYFLYRGQPMGYEYELLQRFAEYVGVEIEIEISHNLDSLINILNAGEVDLVAHGMTITSERKKTVNFTDYLYLTHQVLVQKKPDDWRKIKWSKLQSSIIHDAIELINDTVSVRQNSAYFQRIENLANEMGGKIYIDTLPGNLSTDKIIEMVVNGEIKYTVADNNLASISASYYPVLDIDVPISFSQRMGWALRTNSPELENALNEWLKSFKKDVDYYVIYNKYFKNKRGFKNREKSDYFSLNGNKISKYDNIVKTYAKSINWDWLLLAAQIYQESQFEPKANSWAGARGLMQIMPATAKSLGVTDIQDPEQSVKGGTKYLDLLWQRFDAVEDSIQRIKFTLAAYNCGFSHVVDAQNLAKEEGFNEILWDDNVEDMILKLSNREYFTKPFIKYGYVRGREPYNYIEQIFERYELYK